MHKKFKYSAKFDAVATFNHGKWKEAKASKDVFADLSDLRALLPSDEEIGENPDLLYTSFNAAVANVINANDHGIGTETALAISKYFVHRQMNIEHDRWEIVGHIISQGFSTFGDNKMTTSEALAGTDQPFNIALGAVVYRVSRGYLAEFIEESADPRSCYHQDLSTSWEIGFDEFDIVLGSRKIADANIISDEEEKKKYIPYLRMEGGSGMTDDGVPVYCLIKGDARPLGCAFTSNPAAPVKGLCIASVEDFTDPKLDEILNELKESKEQIASLATRLEEKEEELSKKSENIVINNSQSTKINVTTNSMKFKSIDDITTELFTNEGTASAMKEFIRDQVTNSAETALNKLTEAEDARRAAETSLAEAKATLGQIQTELADLKNEKIQRDKQEEFSARMEEINSEFELSAAQSKAVAAQIKDMEEAAFASWKDNFALFGSKKVEASATDKTEKENEEDEKLNALKKAEASETVKVPNAQNSAEEKTDYTALFKDIIVFKH